CDQACPSLCQGSPRSSPRSAFRKRVGSKDQDYLVSLPLPELSKRRRWVVSSRRRKHRSQPLASGLVFPRFRLRREFLERSFRIGHLESSDCKVGRNLCSPRVRDILTSCRRASGRQLLL